MEYKQYKRYTKPLSTKEIKCEKMDMTNVQTIDGIATFIRARGSGPSPWEFYFRINGEMYCFPYDNVSKFIYRNLNPKDKISITMVTLGYFSYILSFTNHKQGYTIVNKQNQTISDYQCKQKEIAEEKERKLHEIYEKHHGLICNYINEPFLYFVLSRKKNPNSKYKYKLLEIERPSKVKEENMLFGLLSKYMEIPDNFREQNRLSRWFNQNGLFYDIPNTDITIVLSFPTGYKKKDCRFCGNGIDNNYSIPIGSLIAPEYYCAYCFFDKNEIEVPKSFLKNI
jgi:hypothetical protein